MRILFDQGTPVPLRNVLPEHQVETAFERGWSELRNGDLIRQAELEGFEVFLTTDSNLKYQQNLSQRSIAIVVLISTSWPKIQKKLPAIVEALRLIQPGGYNTPKSRSETVRAQGRWGQISAEVP